MTSCTAAGDSTNGSPKRRVIFMDLTGGGSNNR